jgi:hypothetical protein
MILTYYKHTILPNAEMGYNVLWEHTCRKLSHQRISSMPKMHELKKKPILKVTELHVQTNPSHVQFVILVPTPRNKETCKVSA